MDLSPEMLKMFIIIGSIIASNAITIAVMKAQNTSLDRRVGKAEAQIQKLWEDTRYIMTGNEIRRILQEAIEPLGKKVDSLHDDVITMKARSVDMRTRSGDA